MTNKEATLWRKVKETLYQAGLDPCLASELAEATVALAEDYKDEKLDLYKGRLHRAERENARLVELLNENDIKIPNDV